jgi:hypothetical protein
MSEGLYRAKIVTPYDQATHSCTALIPQLYGDAVVPIFRFAAPPPLATPIGWVGLESGDVSYPVWAGCEVSNSAVGTFTATFCANSVPVELKATYATGTTTEEITPTVATWTQSGDMVYVYMELTFPQQPIEEGSTEFSGYPETGFEYTFNVSGLPVPKNTVALGQMLLLNSDITDFINTAEAPNMWKIDSSENFNVIYVNDVFHFVNTFDSQYWNFENNNVTVGDGCQLYLTLTYQTSSLPTGATNPSPASLVARSLSAPAIAPAREDQFNSELPPSSPAEGDQWFNSTNGRFYTFYNGAWVETGGSGSGGGSNGIVTGTFTGTWKTVVELFDGTNYTYPLVAIPCTGDDVVEITGAYTHVGYDVFAQLRIHFPAPSTPGTYYDYYTYLSDAYSSYLSFTAYEDLFEVTGLPPLAAGAYAGGGQSFSAYRSVYDELISDYVYEVPTEPFQLADTLYENSTYYGDGSTSVYFWNTLFNGSTVRLHTSNYDGYYMYGTYDGYDYPDEHSIVVANFSYKTTELSA